eukprot:914132-Lingulodinium_polyedra.AAC.1
MLATRTTWQVQREAHQRATGKPDIAGPSNLKDEFQVRFGMDGIATCAPLFVCESMSGETCAGRL